MTVLRRLWALISFLAVVLLRQSRTEPFRSYLLVRIGTLAGGSLVGAGMLGMLRPVLAPHANRAFYLLVLAVLFTLVGVGLVFVQLLLQRWLNLGSLRRTLTRAVVLGVSEAVFARSLPRTYLVVFLLLILGPWAFSARTAGPWFQAAPWADLATVAAGVMLIGWWNLGEDSEATAGMLIWASDDRPVRFFPRHYDPVGERGRRTTRRLLDLPENEARGLLEPDWEGAPRSTVHRYLVGQMLSELTSRLASVVGPDELSEAARRPLPALGGVSVLALARRAAEPDTPPTVADLVVTVGGLTRPDLSVARPDDRRRT